MFISRPMLFPDRARHIIALVVSSKNNCAILYRSYPAVEHQLRHIAVCRFKDSYRTLQFDI